jgi:hypothetical protein
MLIQQCNSKLEMMRKVDPRSAGNFGFNTQHPQCVPAYLGLASAISIKNAGNPKTVKAIPFKDSRTTSLFCSCANVEPYIVRKPKSSRISTSLVHCQSLVNWNMEPREVGVRLHERKPAVSKPYSSALWICSKLWICKAFHIKIHIQSCP